jgi:hypothetical protein
MAILLALVHVLHLPYLRRQSQIPSRPQWIVSVVQQTVAVKMAAVKMVVMKMAVMKMTAAQMSHWQGE